MLLIDKPSGPTSHDVVDRVRAILKEKRVGHTGTLDPLASGLLVICVGRATKVARYLAGEDKEYQAVIRLGVTTTTQDRTGEKIQTRPVEGVTRADVEAALPQFIGLQKQTPPAFSAVKVQGVPAYRSARRGEPVALTPREIEVFELQLTACEMPLVTLRIRCSKGTYVRALAAEIGERLGTGAHLAELRRTKVGPWDVAEALTVDQLQQAAQEQKISARLIPLARALPLSKLSVSAALAERIGSGPLLTRENLLGIEGDFAPGDPVVLVDPAGLAIAVGEVLYAKAELFYRAGPLFRYHRVLV